MSDFEFHVGDKIEWYRSGDKTRTRGTVAREDGSYAVDTIGKLSCKTLIRPEGQSFTTYVRTSALRPRGSTQALALTVQRLGQAAEVAAHCGLRDLEGAFYRVGIALNPVGDVIPTPETMKVVEALGLGKKD